MSNYPPGVSDSTPGAPWNEPECLNKCLECGCELLQEVDGRRYVWNPHSDDYSDRELLEGDSLCAECLEKLSRLFEDAFGGEWTYDQATNTWACHRDVNENWDDLVSAAEDRLEREVSTG